LSYPKTCGIWAAGELPKDLRHLGSRGTTQRPAAFGQQGSYPKTCVRSATATHTMYRYFIFMPLNAAAAAAAGRA